MNGLTLDTGALIAMEVSRGERARRLTTLVDSTHEAGRSVTVPTVVVVEWWRGQRGPAARMLDAMDVEPLSLELALVAGRALADVAGKKSKRARPSITDAVVMASAASRGDAVLTGDVEDLEGLRAYFPNVKVLGV